MDVSTELPQLPIKGYSMYDEEAIVKIEIGSKLGKENSRMYTYYYLSYELIN